MDQKVTGLDSKLHAILQSLSQQSEPSVAEREAHLDLETREGDKEEGRDESHHPTSPHQTSLTYLEPCRCSKSDV